MSDKNLDVDRAIASVGGERWTYYSFKPVLTNASRTGPDSLFTYNELGEPEYAAQHLQIPPPSAFASPDDEYLEDAAYPETHPNDTWDDVPAPEDHTARFIAPAVPLPDAPEPAAIMAPAPPIAAKRPPSPPAPSVFAAPQAAAATRPAYVPFLPSALPQASVHTSAKLYRPAERPAERPLERALERSLERPTERPIERALPQIEPVVTPQAQVALPVLPAASPPVMAPPVMAPPVMARPVPMVAPVPQPVPAPPPASPPPAAPRMMAQPAFRPAPPPPPRAPQQPTAHAAATPYPQPFGTLADMYARLARKPQDGAVVAPSNPPGPTEIDEQKMFRRL